MGGYRPMLFWEKYEKINTKYRKSKFKERMLSRKGEK
jgi:hypothetical protein